MSVPSNEELLQGLRLIRRKRRIHERHRLSVGTAAIRSDINVTPLVDVVLVLLIIFIVVTPMITRGRSVEMPETEHHDKKNDSGEQIIVSISCENAKLGPDRWVCGSHAIWVGPERVDENSLADKIQQEMRRSPGHEIHIKADKRLNYGPVREVMQRINAIGVGAVALGSDERKEKK
ncbi:MAG: biopolymer transporter ExbD [Myxococcales bacterium]|nr:biopolymer transporter ExbD [Myxococcota bacterium]MDW8283383.1 biopolymer transporter ExbD [Myxococcales bacterium]